MDTPVTAKQAADLRDYLAKSQRFSPGFAPASALMGSGFVVSRFGIFGDQLHLPRQFSALSLTRSHPGLEPRNSQIVLLADRSLQGGVSMASLPALIGMAMTIHLILFPQHSPASQNGK